MKLCEHDCTPECDFCINAIHEYFKGHNGRIIKGGPIGCKLHPNEEFTEVPCDGFHCFNVKE